MPTSSLAVNPQFSYDQEQPGTYPVQAKKKDQNIPGSMAIWILVFAEDPPIFPVFDHGPAH